MNRGGAWAKSPRIRLNTEMGRQKTQNLTDIFNSVPKRIGGRYQWGVEAVPMWCIIILDSSGFESVLGPPYPVGRRVLSAPGPHLHRCFLRTGAAWQNACTCRNARCAGELTCVRARTADDPGIPKSVAKCLCSFSLLTPRFEPAALQTAPHLLPGPRQHDPKVVFRGNIQGVGNLIAIDTIDFP